nr:PD-(D/E)XK nuclease family protein [Erythrobacter ramosus]
MNPWAIAGLKRDEVRNAAALAGLWQTAFGGDASRRFLAEYLQIAIEGIAWDDELRGGYQISTEVCPIGDRTDRVDLVVETKGYVVGIEVKIDALMGRKQLERYLVSINRRATLRKAKAFVVLLAPFRSPIAEVSSTSWSDVALAARVASKSADDSRTFIAQFIAAFGDHVSRF